MIETLAKLTGRSANYCIDALFRELPIDRLVEIVDRRLLSDGEERACSTSAGSK